MIIFIAAGSEMEQYTHNYFVFSDFAFKIYKNVFAAMFYFEMNLELLI